MEKKHDTEKKERSENNEKRRNHKMKHNYTFISIHETKQEKKKWKTFEGKVPVSAHEYSNKCLLPRNFHKRKIPA